MAWTVGVGHLKELSFPLSFADNKLKFGASSCLIGIEVRGKNPDVFLRAHAVGERRAAKCTEASSNFEITNISEFIKTKNASLQNRSFLASVVTSSGAMLSVRGVPILKTQGKRLDTYVVADFSAKSLKVLQSHQCYTLSSSLPDFDFFSCKKSSATRSFAALVRGCGGDEANGCCRMFRFIGATKILFNYVGSA